MHKWAPVRRFLENFYPAFHGFAKRLFYMGFYRWLKNDQLSPRVMGGGMAWFAQLL